jgi:hypothetical protein
MIEMPCLDEDISAIGWRNVLGSSPEQSIVTPVIANEKW